MGRLVGETDAETTNKVVLDDGRSGSLSCAGDIHLTGLYSDAVGSAECPTCGRTIELAVRGRKVADLSPTTALLYYVRVALPSPTSFGIECETTNLFDRQSCLDEWLRSHPHVSGRTASPQGFIDEVVSVKSQGGGRAGAGG